MAGPSDISTILSQAGRIEKITQNPFVQSEVAKQILTEEEARARMQRGREVAESKKAQEISISEEAKQESRRRAKDSSDRADSQERATPSGETAAKGTKHIIDVVV